MSAAPSAREFSEAGVDPLHLQSRAVREAAAALVPECLVVPAGRPCQKLTPNYRAGLLLSVESARYCHDCSEARASRTGPLAGDADQGNSMSTASEETGPPGGGIVKPMGSLRKQIPTSLRSASRCSLMPREISLP